MDQLPIEIPESLEPYFDLFHQDPVRATNKLRKDIERRGPDAVAYCLLAWFYHQRGLDDPALFNALKAKTYAPGSTFFEHLPFYMAHPDGFNAVVPDLPQQDEADTLQKKDKPGPVLDLDSLIDRLSSVESQRIKPDMEKGGEIDWVPDKAFENIDDIASETLANIHETQGKTEAAINTYQRLKKLNKEKREFYKEQINRLKQLRKVDNNGPEEEE
ncbi:MAG: hypothetical protein R3211_06915 [Balneolaceae bacterium]|nr:hypothetical protein [Balneolaceae bacterium]